MINYEFCIKDSCTEAKEQECVNEIFMAVSKRKSNHD